MFTKRNLLRTFLIWLPLAAAITIMSLLIELSTQHELRISANDPQIQIAEDSVAMLEQGELPENLTPPQPVDISKTLAPYIMIFDDSGKVVTSSASLHGNPAVVPAGVFNDAKLRGGELRFTWQPEPLVRQAVILKTYAGNKPGFVLVGRSLREVELREFQQLIIVVATWLIAMVVSLKLTWLGTWLMSTKYFTKK